MGTCSGSCTGRSLWGRARAARSGSRRGCEREHPLLARYFTSRASRLRLALGNAALAALAAAGSRSGLVLWTRARYSGLALGLVLVLGARDRTLGRCDRNNPVALRAFRIQPALGDRWPRALRLTRGRSPGRSTRCGGRPDGEPTAIAGHRCPPLGPSEGDVNEKLEKTEEEIGQTEAVEKKGEMLQEEVCDRRRLQKEAGMRSPPLIVWRTCHQTETHSARRSLHKYWRTQKKRESTLFLGWLIPAGRRKSSSNFERMLPTTP